jgi:POT family proton-dependent oligopeptide transporter
MDASTAPVGIKTGKQWFFGHPGGLFTLAFTEGWVGFSYYGMQSLLVLYMTSQLLLPQHLRHVIGFAGFHSFLDWLYGHREGAALASSVMGLYSALIFATPLLGGIIADRLLGRTRTIILGAVLMTIGHFLMAFDASFLIALACIITGMGCAGTLKAQVGDLYAIDDTRRADAFQIYVMSVNVAVIIAPLICGTLGEGIAWHWGFAAAGVGMLIGLIVYLVGRRSLPPEPVRKIDGRTVHPPLTTKDYKALAVLAALLPVLAVAAIGNQEIFNGYLIWAKANYELHFFGHIMPVSWLLSLDAFISVGTLLAAVVFWRWWSKHHRDPDEIIKMTIGAAIAALAPAILAAASAHAAGGHKVGLIWGVGFHVVNDIGFANVYAIGLALFSRAAPAALGATVVNAYVLHLFLANLLVGWLAGLLEVMPPTQFWLMHTALIAGAAVVLLIFARVFRNILAPTATPTEPIPLESPMPPHLEADTM